MNVALALSPDTDLFSRLVAVLGHTLWQGALVSLTLWVVLRRLPASHPERRYSAALLALTAIVVAAFFTWHVPASSSVPSMDISPGFFTASAVTSVTATPQEYVPAGASPAMKAATPAPRIRPSAIRPPSQTPWQRVLAYAWMGGVALMLLRLVSSVRTAARLGFQSAPLNDPSTFELACELQRRLGLTRSVPLVVSDRLAGPATIGGWKPLVLLPASMLTSIPPDHLRAILAHELAHIRRHDYLINIGQMVVESLLFFNPAVWWVSRQIRLEREACCDALASRAIDDSVSCAEAMAMAAEQALGRSPLPLAAAAATGGRPRSGALADRVRRLLVPGYRPDTALPWHGLATTLIIWSGILASLWGGSLATTAAAARFLTPVERIGKVVEAELLYGQRGSGRLNPEERDRKTTVTGVLRYEDGRPVSNYRHGEYLLRRAGTSYGSSFEVKPGGRFEFPVSGVGDLYLHLRDEGFAPAFAGPVEVESAGTTATVDLLLRRGYTARVRLTDSDDQPLSGALVQGGYWIHYGAGAFQRGLSFQALSDQHGVAEFAQFTDEPVDLHVSADGYQWNQKRDIRLNDGETLDWKVQAALPAEGVVLDALSGAPIEGAAVRLVGTHVPGKGSVQYSWDNATTVSLTGSDGSFRLTKLRGDSTYTFVIDAPPRRRALLADVKPGKFGLVVRMGGPLSVSGFLDDSLKEELECIRRRGDGTLFVTLSGKLPGEGKSAPGRFYEQRKIPLREEFPGGPASFSIDNLFEAETEFQFSQCDLKAEFKLDLRDPVAGLRFGKSGLLSPSLPPEEITTRPVLVRFRTPAGAPLPKGTVMYCATRKPGETELYCGHPTPVTGLEMRFSAPVPGRAMCQPAGMLGYWFDWHKAAEVPSGPGDFVLEYDCIPAGSIGGLVVDQNNQPVQSASLTLEVLRKPPGAERFSWHDSISLNDNGAYHITPLPLGGAYRVTAKNGEKVAVSEVIDLDGEFPSQDVLLQIPADEQ